MQFQAPRGTVDRLPEDQDYWEFVQTKAAEIASQFGYQRIDTPLFEDSRLFIRSVGEVTDIIEKETYTFEDRGGDRVTLRPEGTAPVCRAYLQHGMFNLPQPVRMFYLCPVFRYERPQTGRFRQHHQFGIEVFGSEDASTDAEVIEVAWRFLQSVGLDQLSLSINSIGDRQCRPAYVNSLKAYYRPQVDEICDDCKRRLETNPLRLLDCKVESCQPIIANAPRSADNLCDECGDHWASLKSFLEAVGLPYEVDHTLVRGFDYYTRTVFEISPPIEGRMSTIAGGGRYDGLIEEIGGKPTPGIGFGMGLERVIGNLKGQESPLPVSTVKKVVVAHMGDNAKLEAVRLTSEIRKAGVSAVVGPAGRGLRSQLRYASSVEATHVVIIGDDEIEKGAYVLRNLSEHKQTEIAPADIVDAITKLD